MTVGELIAHLENLDYDLPVCLHTDGFWEELRNPPFETENEFQNDIVAIHQD